MDRWIDRIRKLSEASFIAHPCQYADCLSAMSAKLYIDNRIADNECMIYEIHVVLEKLSRT